jgi:LysR family transcriptional regulator for bpeEF and oprC
MDKLTAMQTFVQIVDAGSFTRAAERLDVPKARVSQRLSDLEAALGVRLLERTTRALRLTDDGRAYHERCVQLLAEIDEAEQALRGRHGHPRGQVRVEAVAAIARHVLAPALQELRVRYPDLTVRLGSSDRMTHLVEDGIDCAVRGGDLPDAGIVARTACTVHLGLYASPDCVARHGRPSHPSMLAPWPRLGWVAARGGVVPWRLMHESGETVELAGPTGLAFDDGDAAVAAAIGGAGAVVAAPFAVAPAVRRGELEPVLPDWEAGLRPVHVLYPSSRQLSTRVRCVVDWVLERLRTDAAMAWRPRDLAAAYTAG